MESALLRSVLYVPASNARAIEKARSLNCDAVILDLEDSVAAEEKPRARDQAAQIARAGNFGHRLLVVRVNGIGTPWWREDIDIIGAARPHAILVPKIGSRADVLRCQQEFHRAGYGGNLWAMVESPGCMLRLSEIAETAGNTALSCLVVGMNDLAREMRTKPGAARDVLGGMLPWVVAAARSANLSVVDGVFNAFQDDEGLQRECSAAADLGFDGKTLIHPRQIEICNRAFCPSPDAEQQARKIIDAFSQEECRGTGVISVDGVMVERLHLAQARDLVVRAEAVRARE